MRHHRLIPAAVTLTAILSVDAPCAAQSSAGAPPAVSRTQELRRLRLAKQKEVTPPTEKRFEKYFKNLDRRGSQSLTGSNFQKFYPQLDWIARGSGIAAGIRYWNPAVGGPLDFMGSAYYSIFSYQHYDLHFGQIPNRGRRMPSQNFERDDVDDLGDVDRTRLSKFKLYGTVRFRDRTDVEFFGLGASSIQENKTSYRIKDTLLDAVTGYQFTDHIGYTFKAGLLQHSLDRGRGRDRSLTGLPGSDNPPNYFRVQNSLLIDYRDAPDDTRRGFMAAFSFENFHQTSSSGDRQLGFSRYGIDARGFFPLGSSQRVLALRLYSVVTDPKFNNTVPFFLMPTLGGSGTLRGYQTHRFRGERALLAQLEYRWYASRRVELALFADSGTVSRLREDFDLDTLRTSWGFGVRLRPVAGWVFRVDQAISNEGYRVLVRFSTAF